MRGRSPRERELSHSQRDAIGGEIRREEGTAEELERDGTRARDGLRATPRPPWPHHRHAAAGTGCEPFRPGLAPPGAKALPHRPTESPPACPTAEAPAVHLVPQLAWHFCTSLPARAEGWGDSKPEASADGQRGLPVACCRECVSTPQVLLWWIIPSQPDRPIPAGDGHSPAPPPPPAPGE